MIKEIYPKEAYELLANTEEALLIDVRSTMEYEFVGHPINAVHIPIKEWPSWDTNQDFVQKLRSDLQQRYSGEKDLSELPLLMLCRSGARSALAAEMLINDGFATVYNVLEGFEGDKNDNGHRNTVNGWRFYDLPWEQS